MKKKLITFSIAAIAYSFLISATSCKKELEGIVDCLAEQSLTSIDASIDPGNSKIYTFKVNYGGTHNLGSVKWRFGDGSEATTVGTATVTHTYAEGSYKVTATAGITKNEDKCDAVVEKTVVVN